MSTQTKRTARRMLTLLAATVVGGLATAKANASVTKGVLTTDMQISTCQGIGCVEGGGNCAYRVGTQIYPCPGCGLCG